MADVVSEVASTGARCVQVGHAGGRGRERSPDDDEAGIQVMHLQDKKCQDCRQKADVGRGPGVGCRPGGTGPAGRRSQRPGSPHLLS